MRGLIDPVLPCQMGSVSAIKLQLTTQQFQEQLVVLIPLASRCVHDNGGGIREFQRMLPDIHSEQTDSILPSLNQRGMRMHQTVGNVYGIDARTPRRMTIYKPKPIIDNTLSACILLHDQPRLDLSYQSPGAVPSTDMFLNVLLTDLLAREKLTTHCGGEPCRARTHGADTTTTMLGSSTCQTVDTLELGELTHGPHITQVHANGTITTQQAPRERSI
jgi:hypothetical protein